jgi:hypothetical protein
LARARKSFIISLLTPAYAYALGRIGDVSAVERLRALAASDVAEVEAVGSVARRPTH